MDPAASKTAWLLAIDLGLRTGLALFGRDGRLRWYRSQHYANRDALRRASHGLLETLPDLAHLAIEGGGPLATIWMREANRRSIPVLQVGAEAWREALLPRGKQGSRSKQSAGPLARQVIAWSGTPRATSLRHDAAEAILLGLWAVHEIGWLPRLPDLS